MAATYELTGAGGKGKSTLKGKIAALIPFEEFLATLQQPSYEDMVEEIRRGDRSINALCDIKLFQAFATFLITTFKTQKDETPMLGTIKQYLSGVVVRVHMDFPENHIMMQTNIVGSWYSKLRSAIDYDVTKRHINAGQNVADDTNPCGRVLLKLICDALLKLGTADALKRRFIICITFCAVGRSGECALATWDSAKYDHDLNNLYMNWNDRKTSTQDPMNFFVDYSSYSICFYHSLFCNLIVHGTDKLKKSGRKAVGDEEVQWICPELAARGYNAASSLTRYVREGLELLPEFKAVKDSYSGKSLRKGAASAMLYHERCSMADAILRGGWKLSAFNTIFEYISVDLGPITYAGRALANYPYPRRNYPSPKCNFINEMDSDQKNRFNSFLTYLFVISVPGMNVDGHLWPLAYLLIATFLKDMDHMITEYGDSHIVNKKVYDAAKSNGWLKADLNKWSIRVKEDYRKDNLIDLGGENIVHNLNETVRSMRADISDISGRINLLERVSREAARELEQSMTEMRANNSELKSSILELNEMIKGIVKNSTRSPTSPYPPSSTHSRKRTSTTMDAETTLIKTSIQTSDSIEDNVSTSSSTSSSLAAPVVLNAMEMMMKSSRLILAGYYIESLKGVSAVDTYYEYELRNLDNPTRGSGWAMKGGGMSVKTESAILSAVRNVVSYLKSVHTEEEIQFFAPRKPFHTSAGYSEYLIQLRKMAEIVVMRAFDNLAVLDPPSSKGGGHNMTVAAMSRRITNFIRVTPDSVNNLES